MCEEYKDDFVPYGEDFIECCTACEYPIQTCKCIKIKKSKKYKKKNTHFNEKADIYYSDYAKIKVIRDALGTDGKDLIPIIFKRMINKQK